MAGPDTLPKGALPTPPPPSAVEAREQAGSPLSAAKVAELVDRLAGADEGPFVLSWLESLALDGGARPPRPLPPPIAVRLILASREAGRLDRARALAEGLPALPRGWDPLDRARLGLERAILANLDGRSADAERERVLASRELAYVPADAGLRERLDLHLLGTELQLRASALTFAAHSLRLAEQVAAQLDDGGFRVAISMSLGHLAMRLADPRAAAAHYLAALARAPSRGSAAMRAHSNVALAQSAVGAIDEARAHARTACAQGRELAAGWRHADAYDVLALVEIAADRPKQALAALDTALELLAGDDQPTLRYQLASHRTFALAAAGRAARARASLLVAERLRAGLKQVDAIDAQDLIATRARTLESALAHQEALDEGLPHVAVLPEAFVTGTLNLVLGRCALAVNQPAVALACVERAALSGELHGWAFPERGASRELFTLALRSGDSRVVRFAGRMLHRTMPALGAASDRRFFVTTRDGVVQATADELPPPGGGERLYVDTISHTLHAGGVARSLERRRALEPLVVELLRRAKDGLSAEDVLRAAGGPGPDSADAEHRVRVLISRVRELMGDASLVSRLREAGEHGRTRYRLAADVAFVLVEPAPA